MYIYKELLKAALKEPSKDYFIKIGDFNVTIKEHYIEYAWKGYDETQDYLICEIFIDGDRKGITKDKIGAIKFIIRYLHCTPNSPKWNKLFIAAGFSKRVVDRALYVPPRKHKINVGSIN